MVWEVLDGFAVWAEIHLRGSPETSSSSQSCLVEGGLEIDQCELVFGLGLGLSNDGGWRLSCGAVSPCLLVCAVHRVSGVC